MARRLVRYTYDVIFYLALIGVWEAFVKLTNYPTYILPAPSDVAAAFAGNAAVLLWDAGVTLYESVIGFALAVVVASVLALAVVYFEGAYRTLYPLILIVNAVPKTAVAPLFVVWFGLGLGSKVIMAFAISFFPIFNNAITGLSEVNRDIIDVVRVINATKIQEYVKVRIPSASIIWFAGLKAALPLTIVGAVVAEFISASQGLGYYILSASGVVDIPKVFAALVMVTVISLGMFFSLVGIERVVLGWSPSRRKR